jgi:cytosine/adenosine deaminase-related metal-dependent hydrolase
MHLAESRAELALLASQQGPLVEFLIGLEAWHPASIAANLRPLDYLKSLATAHRTLVIHGNYLAADEIAFLAANRDCMSVVYCPRTHAYFDHDSYPLAQMLAAGVRVAVGTDSRASNPDLRLFEELRHIARHHPIVSSDRILRMGTLNGAEALGLADSYGSITVGKRAALITVPLADSKSPLESILHGDAQQIELLDSLAH